jgi:hypothetical protein
MEATSTMLIWGIAQISISEAMIEIVNTELGKCWIRIKCMSTKRSFFKMLQPKIFKRKENLTPVLNLKKELQEYGGLWLLVRAKKLC